MCAVFHAILYVVGLAETSSAHRFCAAGFQVFLCFAGSENLVRGHWHYDWVLKLNLPEAAVGSRTCVDAEVLRMFTCACGALYAYIALEMLLMFSRREYPWLLTHLASDM